MMKLILFFVSLFAVPCLATDPNKNTNEDVPLSPVTRWFDLHRKILENGPRPNIDRDEFQEILNEMKSIEQTDAYTIGIKPFDDIRGHPINHHRGLVNRCYAANLLQERNATVTDVLLLTFDHDSNDCTKDFFDLLDDINESFADSQISYALYENRELQYKNCWTRFMESLMSTTSLLGSRIRAPLNKLFKSVYPNSTGLITISDDRESLEFRAESTRIARKIAKFIEEQTSSDTQSNSMEYYDEDFQHLVEFPCSLLLNSTNYIMSNIFSMIKYCGNGRDFITSGHAMILNRYILCNRIMSDIDTVRLNVRQFTMIERRLPNYPISQQAIQPMITNLNPIETHQPSSLNEPNYEALITQHQSFDEPAVVSVQQTTTTTIPQIREQPGEYPARVLRVDKGVGKAKFTRYPTHWSDGSKTLETKKYLMAHWPDQLMVVLRRQAAANQARYLRRQQARAGQQQEDSQEPITLEFTPEYIASQSNDPTSTRRVLSIGRGIGRGQWTKYPTIWSDGTTTYEKKAYLMQYWRPIWDSFYRGQRAENQARYELRLIVNANDERIKSKRFRPRIPTSGDQQQPQEQESNKTDHNPMKLITRQPYVNKLKAIKPKLGESIYETIIQQRQGKPDSSARVVSIRDSIRQGQRVKYQTIWSDGTMTLQTKEFLVTHWWPIWENFKANQREAGPSTVEATDPLITVGPIDPMILDSSNQPRDEPEKQQQPPMRDDIPPTTNDATNERPQHTFDLNIAQPFETTTISSPDSSTKTTDQSKNPE